jgi:hypothetical protein
MAPLRRSQRRARAWAGAAGLHHYVSATLARRV